MSHLGVLNEQIYYERSTVRSSQTLLFVHGVGGAVESWAAIRRFFSNYDSIYIDLPGHGRSSKNIFDVHTNAEIIKSCIEQWEDLGSLVYVGISYGTAVGIELACAYPELLTALVLMSPRTNFTVTSEELQDLIASVESGDFVERGAGSQTSESMKAGMRRGMLATPLETVEQLFQKFNGFDRSADISNIQVPTLIVAGSEDGISDPDDAKHLSDAIQDSKLVELTTGHFIPIERPRETAQILHEFLEML